MKKTKGKFEIAKYFLLFALLIIGIGFGIATPVFLSPENILDIIREASIVGLMGLGMTIGFAAG
ncbi:MAG: ABC transporter permease, partial [Clostridium sp.]|nr:ABC transporter permease [Clostridium sp.]